MVFLYTKILEKGLVASVDPSFSNRIQALYQAYQEDSSLRQGLYVHYSLLNRLRWLSVYSFQRNECMMDPVVHHHQNNKIPALEVFSSKQRRSFLFSDSFISLLNMMNVSLFLLYNICMVLEEQYAAFFYYEYYMAIHQYLCKSEPIPKENNEQLLSLLQSLSLYDEYIHNYNSPTLHKTTFLYTHSNQLHHILKSIYIYDSTLNTSLQNDSYLLDMNLFNLYKQCSKKSLTSQEIHLSTFTWKEQPSFSMDPSKEQNLSYALDHLITKEKEQWDTSTLMNLFMKEFHSLHIHKTMENLTCFLYIYSASQSLYTHQQSKIQELLELLTNSLSLSTYHAINSIYHHLENLYYHYSIHHPHQPPESSTLHQLYSLLLTHLQIAQRYKSNQSIVLHQRIEYILEIAKEQCMSVSRKEHSRSFEFGYL